MISFAEADHEIAYADDRFLVVRGGPSIVMVSNRSLRRTWRTVRPPR